MSEKTDLSEITLKVGKKGEIFTNSDLGRRANIRKGGKVKANVVGNKLIIEAIPSIEELLKRKPRLKITTREFGQLSEEIQNEEKIYG